MMEIITHYRDNETLRRSFNDLVGATFGLDFEGWYQNGFWTDCYRPYSVWEDGRIVANVSLNRTDLLVAGERKRLYQLGTVMTAPEYRGRGYIRALMERLDADIADADGVYLFANDSVLDFYPKFGFRRGREMVWSRKLEKKSTGCLRQVPMDSPEGWAKLAAAMAESTLRLGCCMVDNPGLIFFYVSQFLQGCVYLHEPSGTWVIAEAEGAGLTLHNVFSKAPVTLEEVLGWFGGVREVVLGFTPEDTAGFICAELKEEDCTFFVRGDWFREFEEQKLRIPTLSHA